MKYFIWILGCAMNYSDAERMATVFDNAGYQRTFSEKEANLFIVISCSVRESAILRIYGKVKDLKDRKNTGEKLITVLTGCVLEKDRKKLKNVFDIIVETKDIEKLPADINHLNNFSIEDKSPDRDNLEYFKIKPHYQSNFKAFVPISTGCDNFCSYCAVPYTRGREKSRPMNDIITEVNSLIMNGYKEITLVGQNVNSYGHDITGNPKDNSPFIELISKIDEIPGDYRVYFYSNHPKDMTTVLIKKLAQLVHFPHYIHLPLQSGNNEILQKMNRHNTREDYLNLVKMIRTEIPDVTLTTDVIVGYPGETEKQFLDTADVMEKAKFDMAFIAQYSPRTGTVSAKQLDNVTLTEKKAREAILQKIITQTVLEHNEYLIDTIQKVLVDEQKTTKFYGRTLGYKVVEINTGQPLEIGQYYMVKIETATSWKLFGKLL